VAARSSQDRVLRIKGELLLLQGAAGVRGAAEDHFRQALDWARRQGQRESVELPADRCNYRHKAAVRRKTRLCRPRPLDEQPNGAVAQRIVVSRDIGRRHGEPLHRINPFARRSERLAAGGDDMQRRGGPQYSLGYRRGGSNHMLAGIEHQQQAPAGERLRHAVCRSFAAAELQADSGSHRGRDQPGIGEGRELGQPHAVGKVRSQLAGECERQRCLADAAGPGQGDEPMRGDEIEDLAELLLPADQLGNRLRNVGRRRD
jgi:hypothetical protein